MRQPSVEQVIEHQGPVGIVYASISAACLDVDRVEDPDAVSRLAAACHTSIVFPSRQPGRYHVVVPDDRPHISASFSYLGCSGDIRGATGYAIVWNAEGWKALDTYIRNLPLAEPAGIPDALIALHPPSYRTFRL